ncbi:MAG: YceI family protein [Alphaproteobacteria bacterium]|nr:YceI family protein [Alphaproteobacteria bacterium]
MTILRLIQNRFLTMLAVLAVAAGLSAPSAKAEMRDYVLDPEHLTVAFLVHHIGYADTLGRFNRVEGGFRFDEESRTLGGGEIVVHTESVDTGHQRRDDHLRGTDFFNVKEHPTMTFTFADGEPVSDRTGKVEGTLTLLGVSQPLSLDVTWNKSGRYPFGAKPYVMGISARGTVKRSEFGMMYAVENGWVGDEIELIIEIEAIRQD